MKKIKIRVNPCPKDWLRQEAALCLYIGYYRTKWMQNNELGRLARLSEAK